MDLKEDLDKKLKNKKSIDEWLKSYQNAINVLNSSYIDEDSIKIFLLSSNQIVHFNNFVNILYKDSKLPTSKNKYYKKIFKYSIGESIDGRSKKSPIKEFPIGSKMVLILDKGATAAQVTHPDNIAEDCELA